MIDRGMLGNKNQIIELLKKYPKGTIFFVLRNFNNIDRTSVVGINAIPKGKAEYSIEKNTAYVNRVSVREGFFPKEIIKKIEDVEKQEKMIPIGFFIDIGQDVANSLKRKVIITHQYGSGDQSQASFDDYEFTPN